MGTFDFNSVSMNRFSGVQNLNENTIVQLDGDQTKAAGTWSGKNIFRFMRSSATKADNNAVRAQLLDSLGKAFGVEGAGVDAEGKLTFSKAFMDRLEDILGRDTFKRADFGIDSQGRVTSGKPLTQRRISAILTKATVVGKIGFNIADYRVKVNSIKASLDSIPDPNDRAVVKGAMNRATAMLEFLENNLDGLIEENPLNYLGYENKPRFVIAVTDMKEGENLFPGGNIQPVHSAGNKTFFPLNRTHLREHIQSKFGFLVHLENVTGDLTGPNIEKDIKQYIGDLFRLHITTAVDLVQDTLGTDDFKGTISAFRCSNPCIEGKTSEMRSFQEAKGLVHTFGSDAPAEPAADHDESVSLYDCIGRELSVIANSNKTNGDMSWKTLKPILVDHLVGLNRPIGVKDNAPLGKVTEADIERFRQNLIDDDIIEE